MGKAEGGEDFSIGLYPKDQIVTIEVGDGQLTFSGDKFCRKLGESLESFAKRILQGIKVRAKSFNYGQPLRVKLAASGLSGQLNGKEVVVVKKNWWRRLATQVWLDLGPEVVTILDKLEKADRCWVENWHEKGVFSWSQVKNAQKQKEEPCNV